MQAKTVRAKAKKPATNHKKAPASAAILLILDRSGSMHSVASDVVQAVNKFIADQQKIKAPCWFTLVQFDHENPFEVLTDHEPLAKVQPLTQEQYQPRGNTPLYDAIGKGIGHLETKLKAQGKTAPERVVVVIQTDGMENWSKEFNFTSISSLIKKKQTKAGGNWDFVFLGASLGSVQQAASLGIRGQNINQNAPTGRGYGQTVAASSSNIAQFRCAATMSVAKSALAYSDEQKAASLDPDGNV